MLSGITASFPTLSRSRGYVTTRYSPFRRCPPLSKLIELLARLACLIHAANVHSEPGSNPSILYRFTSKAKASPGEIKVKPKVDSAPEASVKTSSDSPFFFAALLPKHSKQRSRSAELNRSFITKLSKIGWPVAPLHELCRFPLGKRRIRLGRVP